VLMKVTAVALLGLGLLSADTLRLKNGNVIHGTYMGGSSREIRMEAGDQIRTFPVTDVASITFETGASSAAASTPGLATSQAASPQGGFRTADSSSTPAVNRTQPPPGEALVPAGTVLTVRMIDSVDSQKAKLGDTFKASIDEPVAADGRTVIPRGADAIVKLVEDKQSGKLTGRTELTLDMVAVQVDGMMVDVKTSEVKQASSSRTARSAKVVGGTAALGAIIGGIAGGGTGAAIGAGSGAAVGTAAQVFTKGQRVVIPSEARLSFPLQDAIRR